MGSDPAKIRAIDPAQRDSHGQLKPDAILVVAFGDYIGGLFHGLALFGIFNGLRALGPLDPKPKAPGSEVIQTLD